MYKIRLLIIFLVTLSLAMTGVAAAAQRPGPSDQELESNRNAFNQAISTLNRLRVERTRKSGETPVVTAQAMPETAPTESPSEEAPAEQNVEEPPATTYRHLPLHTGSIRAPKPLKPSANPLQQVDKKTLQGALLRPLEFGETSLGFEPPDWTEPLRDIEADSMVTDLKTNETVLNDNVRLRLGTMLFQSDEFRYTEEEGHYQATGHVLVRQHESELTADKLTYVAPEPEVVERTFVLEPGPNEQQFAERRLSMGRLLAENLHVVEPTREMQAEYVDYDFATQSGEVRNAHGLATIFYYDAGHIQINGPNDAVIQDLWLTTCPQPEPHYRVHVEELTLKGNEEIIARKARLHLGRFKTPFYVPFWRGGENQPFMLDYESGRRAEIGYFTNLGLQLEASPEVTIGPRIMPTAKEGIGLGGDVYYDFMRKPSSYLYRTKGEAHLLYTTKDRGYGLLRHRWEYDNDLILRLEAEQWSDEQFYKDFFYDDYRNRTTPRTFGNITYRTQDFIATGTTRVNTHSWISETERLPEASFHLIERPLGNGFYGSYDNYSGYLRQKARDIEGFRTVNIARLTYDWDPVPSLSITPFYEAEGAWYQRDAHRDDSVSRFSNTFGITAQTRLHKAYPGFLGFSGFKHVIEPSITYSYRPGSSLSVEDTPRFDPLDNVHGRSRIETKINNILYGRDAETNEVWQAARLTLYQGNDFWNEVRKADDYEFEMDIRPRPWWGVQMGGERHNVDEELNPQEAPVFYKRWFYDLYEDIADRYYNEEAEEYSSYASDFSRFLTQVYYDNTMLGGKITGRLGFAYTDTRGQTYNREILYGLGYRINENWGVGFEHIYNLKGGYMHSQTYELRRRFDCWETALRFRDRESGLDVNVEISLVAFPGSSIRF